MDRPDDTYLDDGPGAEAEQPERLALPSLDSFKAVRDLVALEIDPKSVKRHLRQLHDSLAAVTAGQDKLAADQAAFTAYEQKTREELTAQAAKLREGQVALANAKDLREYNLAERELRIRELEDRWRFIGEDEDVRSGFRTAEFSSLMKARAAHGIGRDHGVDEIAATMREKYPPVRTVKHDPQGTSFPNHVSLSRSEPPPPAAARVRPRRHNTSSPEPA
jgi:hypothetical protein